MKPLFFKVSLLLSAFLICTVSYGEGTKQLKPDTNYICDLNVTNGGGYTCFATPNCAPAQKLYVSVRYPSEKVYLGFGWGSGNLTFRIKNMDNTIVYGPITINSSSPLGYIKYYKEALAGPNKIDPEGYKALVFAPGVPGDYNIEIDPKPIPRFDITVIDTTILPEVAIDGRLWSKDWGFNTSSITNPNGGFWATQYIYSDDSIVTSIYYNEMRGNVFDVTSTRNGCLPPPEPWDSSCRSRSGNHHYAQYKIFLNDPDSNLFPTGVTGVILPNSVSVDRECDGTFHINFSVNKVGSADIDIEVNPAPGHQPEDVNVMDSVSIGVNTIIWNGLNGLGVPVPIGDSVYISITYVNGLSNIALYDVERHLNGFIIQSVRPLGPPIATYWNDTLLRNKGGTTNLTGCLATLPTTGCHAWNGNYNGVGIGSYNTVNTWWYVASVNNIGMFAMAGTPATPTGIAGPDTLCMSTTATYTVVPDPLPGTDTLRYEWVLSDASTSLVLMDSLNAPSSITIDFSLYPIGPKRLKVKGHSAECGAGLFGPGINGEGILIGTNMAPQITNSVVATSICTGSSTNILIQLSNPTATFSYTATSTSPNISGFSGGTQNPIQQTLTNSSATVDSVIYRVVPFASPCTGDTVDFYVEVSPLPQVTNTITTYLLCSGQTTSILLTSNIPGCSFTWTSSASLPDITGFSNGGGSNLSQTLFNSGSSTGTVTYLVTATFGGCVSVLKTFTVTVKPLPLLITIPLAEEVCSGDAFSIPLTSNVSGALYTWSATGSSPLVTGYTQNPGPPVALLNQTLTNNSTINQSVTYHITPVANGCNGPVTDYIVTVLPSTLLALDPMSATICSGDTLERFLTSAPPGGLFTWSCTSTSPNLSGYTAQFVPVDNLIQCIFNAGYTTETVTYHITSAVVGCAGGQNDFTVAVKPRPDIYFLPSAQSICSQLTTSIQNLSHVVGTTFSWSANGSSPLVVGFFPGTGEWIQQTLSNNGISIEQVEYVVSAVNSGCAGDTGSVLVTVNPLPVVSFSACFDTMTTTNAKPIRLSGGIPLGGSYSGPGVSAGYYYPLITGTGNHLITYSYTNLSSCSSSKSTRIHQFISSPFTCGNNFTDIRDGKNYPTVQIGAQCWFASNLNYGNPVSSIQHQRDNCINEKYCYQDVGANCELRGANYQWDELMRYDASPGQQGLCPPAWHVPTEAEWNTLFAVYGGNGFAGSPLKYSGYSGFDAGLNGAGHLNRQWDFESFATFFWSSTPIGSFKAWAHGMNDFDPSVSAYPSARSNAFSVRCVKD